MKKSPFGIGFIMKNPRITSVPQKKRQIIKQNQVKYQQKLSRLEKSQDLKKYSPRLIQIMMEK